MKENIKDVLPFIDKSLEDEFSFLAGCNPIWILNWMTSDRYILRPKQRIVVSPNKKEELIEWVVNDAFSSNSLGSLPYVNGEASEKDMLNYAKEMIRNIEYETDPEKLKETLRCARWVLNETPLIVKELC